MTSEFVVKVQEKKRLYFVKVILCLYDDSNIFLTTCKENFRLLRSYFRPLLV